MYWNLEQLTQILNAQIELNSCSLDNADQYILTFNGKDLKYYLQITPAKFAVNFAADPCEPLQGQPFIEYGFKCMSIDIVTIYNTAPAQQTIVFYEDIGNKKTIRFSMTMRLDGNWYVWGNAWS